MKTKFCQLQSSDSPLEEIPLSEYPRPQLKRDSYICLNGNWDFEASTNSSIPSNFTQKIIVPYCIESYLSGINKTFDENTYFFYKKQFSLNPNFIKDKVILHFDGVDQKCWIYLNDQEIFYHENGYLPFSIDITKYLKEENTLIVKTIDNLDYSLPYGKQSRNRGGMWYTPCSGIWKTVWLESVNKNYIKNIKILSNNNEVTITLDTNAKRKKLTILNKEVKYTKSFSSNTITFKIDNPIFWSCENPFLYNFSLSADEDVIESYFALKDQGIIQKGKFKYFSLNNQPIFINGLLDQGYFCDGIYTPKSYKDYEYDLKTIKELGFNAIRKHIKIEPLYFYYLCDKLGILVIQDMVNNSNYSFFNDTVLPTLGIKRKKDTNLHKNPISRKNFINSLIEEVNLLSNNPSIFMWTIFNEGWGQFDSDKMYDLLISIDSKHLIDSTSGWFKNKKSDVDSQHIYFKKVNIKQKDKPLLISEFGGYVYKDLDHSFNLNKTFGYKIYKNLDQYQKGIKDLYLKQIIPSINKGLSGCIYTQLSDVEDETNGILTYDRKICKLDSKLMKEISNKLKI